MRLYRAFFNREPDVGGASYWILEYDRGASLDDLAFGFSNSTEFLAAYGSNLTDDAFLRILYGNILGRTPDDAGLAYWLGELQGGLGRDGVVRWITANDEFINRFDYSPTFPDMSAALLRLQDMPSGYVEITGEVGRAPKDSGCDSALRMGDDILGHDFAADPDFGPFISHSIEARASAEKAQDYLKQIRDNLPGCATFIDLDRISTRMAEVSFRRSVTTRLRFGSKRTSRPTIRTSTSRSRCISSSSESTTSSLPSWSAACSERAHMTPRS